MDPKIQFYKEGEKDSDNLHFTLSGVNVSLANAVRRTIISDIETVVFKTAPYEENKATFIVNTSRFNNEILKQRLSCIPIHIKDLNMPLQNYLLEVNVENLTDTIQYVTTADFKIKNIVEDTYLSETDNRNIFPPNELGYYIDFARLRPKISDEILGEKLHFTCEFSIGTAKQDCMFNVASTCSYGYTLDDVAIEEELGKKKQKWKDDNKDVEFESKNWLLLEAKRITKKDSFDFAIQSVGVFTNEELVQKATDILIHKLNHFMDALNNDTLQIAESDNTMKNCYDIILENEDYTIGKTLEYMLYAKFFEGTQVLSFCGFKKMHPHDANSIVRVAYKEPTDKSIIKQNLLVCMTDAILIFKTIGDKF